MTKPRAPKTKPTTPARHRMNVKRAARKLAALIGWNFAPDACYYVLPLDLRHFHLDRALLLWNIQTGFFDMLRTMCPDMRYIYALQMDEGVIALHLLSDAPQEYVEFVHERFYLCGGKASVRTLESASAAQLAAAMTLGIYGEFGTRAGQMWTPSKNLIRTQPA